MAIDRQGYLDVPQSILEEATDVTINKEHHCSDTNLNSGSCTVTYTATYTDSWQNCAGDWVTASATETRSCTANDCGLAYLCASSAAYGAAAGAVGSLQVPCF
jgi:hypothetical protein